MKSFFTWFFTTSLGWQFVICWILFYVIFIWQGFETVASLIVDGEMLTANASFIFCILCVSALSVMTAQNYRINWLNPRKK